MAPIGRITGPVSHRQSDEFLTFLFHRNTSRPDPAEFKFNPLMLHAKQIVQPPRPTIVRCVISDEWTGTAKSGSELPACG
ncbi:hypothetical protein Mal65_18610 [Crateriforma conspicua]|nr:hypothetical protein Mal65_18610 [Crateriforma conspicua]